MAGLEKRLWQSATSSGTHPVPAVERTTWKTPVLLERARRPAGLRVLQRRLWPPVGEDAVRSPGGVREPSPTHAWYRTEGPGLQVRDEPPGRHDAEAEVLDEGRRAVISGSRSATARCAHPAPDARPSRRPSPGHGHAQQHRGGASPTRQRGVTASSGGSVARSTRTAVTATAFRTYTAVAERRADGVAPRTATGRSPRPAER